MDFKHRRTFAWNKKAVAVSGTAFKALILLLAPYSLI